MKVGYIRVSTDEQNTARQEVIMQQMGVEKVFLDKQSGAARDRLQLAEMLAFVREGDIVVVESISRFARNTRHLLELVDDLKSKGVEFISQKEGMDTNTASGKFMLTIFGAIAELEREYIRSRQMEGIKVAKEQGKYSGRPKIDVDIAKIYTDWKSNIMTSKRAMEVMGVKSNTFYRRIAEYEAKLKELEN